MSDDEQKALLERLAAEYTRHVDYVRASTILISLLPILYGFVTFVFGTAVWASNPVFRTALDVPGAPQSWGALFLIFGIATVILAAKDRHLGVTYMTIATSIVLASFMVSFIIECFRDQSLQGLPPAVVFGIFSVAFLNRCRFAFTSWRAMAERKWPWSRES